MYVCMYVYVYFYIRVLARRVALALSCLHIALERQACAWLAQSIRTPFLFAKPVYPGLPLYIYIHIYIYIVIYMYLCVYIYYVK